VHDERPGCLETSNGRSQQQFGNRDAENREVAKGAKTDAKKNWKLVRTEVPFTIFTVPAGKHEDMRQGRKGAKSAKLKNFLLGVLCSLAALALSIYFFAASRFSAAYWLDGKANAFNYRTANR
jgi:hypothetical protein